MGTVSESLNSVRRNLIGMARAHQCLCSYACADAIRILSEEVCDEQKNSAWSLCLLGRAHFESARYRNAVKAFQKMRKVDPSWMRGLEYYSTALWHLKEEVELSFLAQEAVATNRLAPESWMCVGNCFSLQKEHDTALKFFHRAVQLCPTMAYGYTLAGHEYVANEDFEKACAAYRHAIRVQPRHYNAWYGLGNIFYRREKHELAVYHFQRAAQINSGSSVLFCYLGMVLKEVERYAHSLLALEKAVELDSGNPLARFQKANVYFTIDKPEDALEELLAVLELAPSEASVHFLLGKVHKKLGNTDKAMMSFNTALDLDPRDKDIVKSELQRLDERDSSDEEESEEEFAEIRGVGHAASVMEADEYGEDDSDMQG